jgi:CRP-like cAMP-binding protein
VLRRREADPILELPALTGASGTERTLILANIDTLLLPESCSLLDVHQPAAEVLLVVRGEVETTGVQGRVHGPGAIIGAAAMLNRTPQPVPARTTRPSRIGFISTKQMRALLSGSAAFATAVAVALADEIRFTAEVPAPRPRRPAPTLSR